MDNDDLPVGRMLARREALKLLGGGAMLMAGIGAAGAVSKAQLSECSDTLRGVGNERAQQLQNGIANARPNVCLVRPELTEGPYFVDEALKRSDIRLDSASKKLSAGVPLQLAFHVSDVAGGACRALRNAYVDVWHCDAAGYYSGVESDGTGGYDYLRGLQPTNADGVARFTTIYPGWYQGRAVHIHFKIRGKGPNGFYEFTSQVFFPDVLSEQIFANAPYAQNGQSEIPNTRDGIFRQGGNQLLLTPTRTQNGLSAALHIGLQL